MKRTPLGLDKETWEKRNQVIKREYAKHKSWKAGWEAGRKGESASANPFALPEDIWKLLRRRTLWELGREEAMLTPTKRKLKEEHANKHRKEKHKHKHKKHHRD